MFEKSIQNGKHVKLSHKTSKNENAQRTKNACLKIYSIITFLKKYKVTSSKMRRGGYQLLGKDLRQCSGWHANLPI